jgi:hypothetical protein
MKFDPAMMQALLALDDAALWKKIRQIAAQGGFSIAEAPPPPAEMAKLRALMSGSGQADVASAMQTLMRYRKGG